METNVSAPREPDTRWIKLLLAAGLTVTVAGLLIVALSDGEDSHHRKPHSHDPKIVVVPNSAVQRLPTASNEELVLEGGQEKIVPGDFVTTNWGPNAEESFLLRVLAKEETEGWTKLKTEPGSLFEAVPAGSLVANPSDFVLEPGIAPTSPARVPVEGAAHLAPAAFRQDVAAFDLFDHIPAGFECGEPPQELKLTPSFTPKFDPYLDMRWNGEWLRRRVETVDAGVRGELRAAVTGSVDGEFTCALKRPLKITLFKAVAPVGPVPVPVRLNVKMKPTVTGQLGSKIEGKIEVGVDGFGGIEYADGALRPIGVLVPVASVEPPKIESAASGSVGLTPEVTVVAGWKAPVLGELAAQAALSLPTEVKLRYEPLKKPLPEGCLELALKGTLRLNLPRPLKTFSPKASAERELVNECRPLGGGGEAAPEVG